MVRAFDVLNGHFTTSLLRVRGGSEGTPTSNSPYVLLTRQANDHVTQVFGKYYTLRLLLYARLLRHTVQRVCFATRFRGFEYVLRLFKGTTSNTSVNNRILTRRTVTTNENAGRLAIFMFRATKGTVSLSLRRVLQLCTNFPRTTIGVPRLVVQGYVRRTFRFCHVNRLKRLTTNHTTCLLNEQQYHSRLQGLHFRFFRFPNRDVVLGVFGLQNVLVVMGPVIFLSRDTRFFRTLFYLFRLRGFRSPTVQFLPHYHPTLPPRGTSRGAVLVVARPTTLYGRGTSAVYVDTLGSTHMVIFNRRYELVWGRRIRVLFICSFGGTASCHIVSPRP